VKVGLLSDAHANAPALRAALTALSEQRADQILFAGDAVGYFDDAEETVSVLREHVEHAVLGNHDALLTGALPAGAATLATLRLDVAARALTPESTAWLAERPPQLALELDGAAILVVHGSPWSPLEEYVHRDYPSFERFKEIDADFVVLGHTHRQMIVRVGDLVIVNPGSCGQPRDGGEGAAWALIDTSSRDVTFGTARYDRTT
jgi:putative phosphoesterase